MNRSTTPDDYLKAVHQLKQFLSESDSSDPALFNTPYKCDRSDGSAYSDRKSQSARKNLFKQSPVPKITSGDGSTTESLLTELIQRQVLYIKAIEEELTLYKSEVPGILMEMKLLISSEESCRMIKTDTVTQRLFTLMDTLSSVKSYASHDTCEIEKKNLSQNLDDAKHQIIILKQQWADHVCWNKQNSSKLQDDFSKERAELLSTVNKLRSTVSALQQREADALRQVEQSVEVAEQAQVERAQMETEVRRLVAVVEQHEQQITSLTADHNRRLQDERNRLETKLAEQVSSIKREKDMRDEALTRLSLELEQNQRNEALLKNEIQIKTNLLDSSRQDFQRQISQMQGEHSRLSGQLSELQRRLGEAELRADLSIKAAEQEVCSARTEAEFLRRKLDLLQKELDSRRQDYENTTKELEQRNVELHLTLNQRESERMQAMKATSQANSLVKYLEQREASLLSSLQETRHTCEEKAKELSSIIEEQRTIIQSLKEEYASLIKDYENCLRSVRQNDLQSQLSSLAVSKCGRPPVVR